MEVGGAKSRLGAHLDGWLASLEEPTRGARFFVYGVAGAGLAFAIYKVRPISKFSRPSDVPRHFIREKECLRGKVVDCVRTPGGAAKLLVDHKPIVTIPFWHSSKPPLPVKIWGVKLAEGISINWLQFVAIGQKITFVPLQAQKEALIADVTLHCPILAPPKLSTKTSKRKKKPPQFEDVQLGQRLLEMGLATVDEQIPRSKSQKNWWMPLVADQSPAGNLFRAQGRAVSCRAGIWQEKIPPSKLETLRKYFKRMFPAKPVPSVA